MSKGKQIQQMIQEGKNNDQILEKVDTTKNSINWHRSKLNKANVGTVKVKTKKPTVEDKELETETGIETEERILRSSTQLQTDSCLICAKTVARGIGIPIHKT